MSKVALYDNNICVILTEKNNISVVMCKNNIGAGVVFENKFFPFFDIIHDSKNKIFYVALYYERYYFGLTKTGSDDPVFKCSMLKQVLINKLSKRIHGTIVRNRWTEQTDVPKNLKPIEIAIKMSYNTIVEESKNDARYLLKF